MFITQVLNALGELVEGHSFSAQFFLDTEANLETTLLRTKVLRDFAEVKVQYIVQSAIHPQHASAGLVFAPFILANLNRAVIYQTPATATVLNILNRYYCAEQKINLKVDNVLDALQLYIELSDRHLTDVAFLYKALITALCRSDVFDIFLVTTLKLNTEKLAELAEFLKVKIYYIPLDHQEITVESQSWNMHQLLFKNKDQSYIKLCESFARLNAQVLKDESYSEVQAIQLIEDMFYSEHIYEKLSVYAEYMQTCLQQEREKQLKCSTSAQLSQSYIE